MSDEKREALRRKILARKKAAGGTGSPGKQAAKRPAGFDFGKMMQDKQKNKRSEFFKFDQGITRCVFVRSVGEMASTFYVQQRRFFIPKVGPEKKGVFVVSPRSRSEDEPCLASQVFDSLKSDRRASVKKLVDKNSDGAMGPRDRYLANAFVEENKKFGHKIVEFGWMIFNDLTEAIMAETDPDEMDSEGLDPPVVGSEPRIVSVSKEGKGKTGTKYKATVTSRPYQVSPEEAAKVVDLARFLEPTPEDEVAGYLRDFLKTDDLDAVVEGDWSPGRAGQQYDEPDVAEEEEEAGEDDPPARSQKAPAARDKARRRDPEPEDEEEAEDPEEEEAAASDDLPDETPPDCFASYDEKKKKERGCAKCAFRSVCIDTEEA